MLTQLYAVLCSGVFLVASSSWNQHMGAEHCLCRISEVTDWEEGGRTELSHLQRIFAKERQDADRKVLAVVRQVRTSPAVAY